MILSALILWQAVWAAAAPMKMEGPGAVAAGGELQAVFPVGYYAFVSDAPFELLGEDNKPFPAEWKGGFYVGVFQIDEKPEKVRVVSKARGDSARYELFKGKTPFRLLWLSRSDAGCLTRPARADPPCGPELLQEVASLSVGLPTPTDVGARWRLSGDGENPIVAADVTCEEGRKARAGALLEGSWKLDFSRGGERPVPCSVLDRKSEHASSGFRLELTGASNARLPGPGSLLPRASADQISDR